MISKGQTLKESPLKKSTKRLLTRKDSIARNPLRSRTCIQGEAPIEKCSLNHQSKQREYIVYTPTWYESQHSYPMVLLFHGGYGSADRAAKFTGMNAIAEREGFIVIYPDATSDRHWRDGRKIDEPDVDDVGFVSALIPHVAQIRNIDLRRIYAAGFSNGGAFTARLACELSDQIAAFAQVVSTMAEELKEHCRTSRPVPIMIINGTEDPLVPWKDGERVINERFGKGGNFLTVLEVVEFWVRKNECNSTLAVKRLGEDGSAGSQVVKFHYRNDAADVDVIHLVIEGGGHSWPGATKSRLNKRDAGNANMEINASEEIWNFFNQYALP